VSNVTLCGKKEASNSVAPAQNKVSEPPVDFEDDMPF
jgi:hypothetical protein